RRQLAPLLEFAGLHLDGGESLSDPGGERLHGERLFLLHLAVLADLRGRRMAYQPDGRAGQPEVHPDGLPELAWQRQALIDGLPRGQRGSQLAHGTVETALRHGALASATVFLRAPLAVVAVGGDDALPAAAGGAAVVVDGVAVVALLAGVERAVTAARAEDGDRVGPGHVH